MTTKYNIKAIAIGEQDVNTSNLTPLEALQLGLEVRQYQEENELLPVGVNDVRIDYEAVAKLLKKL